MTDRRKADKRRKGVRKISRLALIRVYISKPAEFRDLRIVPFELTAGSIKKFVCRKTANGHERFICLGSITEIMERKKAIEEGEKKMQCLQSSTAKN